MNSMQIKPAGEFTAQLWQEVTPVYNALVTHPFATGLENGDLPQPAFSHYLSQDMYYLLRDAQALDAASARAEVPAERSFLKRMADEIIEMEKALNLSLSREFGVLPASQPSPVIRRYCDFLIMQAKSASYPVALAALLPCFWLYSQVGLDIYFRAEQNAQPNPYQSWIDCYRATEFITEVDFFIGMVEQQAEKSSESVKEQMKAAFLEASRLELAFFDESTVA
ncbi:TenA family protein [Vibrio sp. JC009]|uniref:TenA family protein n=1 Tax=Vibrio sp. JC009 TaxID=2912314 RepID=UPI0023AF419C|nr:TenA family protein [Vibrio sp. JC009]WED24746.1 TenA family protein [Vibrio sp. JC009]